MIVITREALEHNASVIEKRYDKLTADVYKCAIIRDGISFPNDESVEKAFGASKYDVIGAAGDLTIDGILLLKNHGYGRGCTIKVNEVWHDVEIKAMEAELHT